MAALAKSCDANRPTFPWREPRRVSGVLARTYFATPARPQDVLNASPRHRRPNKFLDFLARPKRFELLTPRFVVSFVSRPQTTAADSSRRGPHKITL
jgi:hypothetical protein